MFKTLMSIECGNEAEMLQKDVAHVCEAMLAFPSRLPFTRFYKGFQVINFNMNGRENYIIGSHFNLFDKL